MLLLKPLAILCLIFASPAAADERVAWSDWLSGFTQEALQSGLDSDFVRSALQGMEPDLRVVMLDRKQPEGRKSAAQYLREALPKQRIARARESLQMHRALLRRVEEKYPIPSRFLVALWAVETDFGRNRGNFHTLRSLLTLAHDGRRAELFRQQSLTFLQLAAQGVLDIGTTGSWAGAMGHVQFMPSTLMRFGKDGDGDGRIALGESLPDAFTSAAYYLHASGWNAQRGWGRPVTLTQPLPAGFAGLGQPRALAEWQSLGVRNVNGAHLPHAPDLVAELIQPDGAGTQAYLVYPNFHVLLEWNRSQRFALSVGLLADAISGG